VAYVTIRLHLNKIIALMCVAACMPAAVPSVCVRVGWVFVKSDAHPHLRWIVGSHVIAIPVAGAVGCLVYAIAVRFQKEGRAVSARSGAARPGSVGSVEVKNRA
jgi:hypothetical protein